MTLSARGGQPGLPAGRPQPSSSGCRSTSTRRVAWAAWREPVHRGADLRQHLQPPARGRLARSTIAV